MSKQKMIPHKKVQIILFLLALVTVIVLMMSQKEVGITGRATLSLQPPSQIVNPGSQLRLDILAAEVTDLAGVQINVNYNPNVLTYDKTTEGTFLNKGSAETLFLDTIDTTQSGIVKYIAIVRTKSGVNGSGIIASVYFTAKNSGYSDLTLQDIMLADSNGNPLSANVVNANISVREAIPPNLTITSPIANAIIQGSVVNVTYTKSGNLNGVDHVHLQLDDNPEIRDLDFDGFYQFTNVPASQHTLKGYLAKADHSKVAGTDAIVPFETQIPLNNPPLISPINASHADVDSIAPGIQFYENTTVTYSASAIDLDGDSLSWIWLYKLNNNPETIFLMGTDNIQPAVFNHPTAANYSWVIRVSDGKISRERILNVSIISRQCIDPDNDGYGPGCNLTNDCDQGNPNINPGSDENCATPFDDNCNDLVNCDDSACTNHTLCKLDADDDGVPDGNDKCPNTKSKHKNKVNIHGCPIPNANKFNLGLTTNFSGVDLRNVTNLKIGIEDRGQILYGNNEINLLENDSEPIDLDKLFEFLPHKVIVYSDLFNQLNASATITLMNITNITNPVIKRDNFTCSNCLIISFKNGNLTFTVPHFTEHSVDEGSFCGDNLCSTQESCSSCSADCGNCPSSDEGGSGSGGGGGGGGVTSSFFVCRQDWQCSDWGACIGGWQTRQCNLVKVDPYPKSTSCPNINEAPAIAMKCTQALPQEQEITQEAEAQETAQEPEVQEVVEIKEPEMNEMQIKSRRFSFSFIITAFALITMILIGIGVYEIKVSDEKNIALEKTISNEWMQELNKYIQSMKSLGKSDEEIKERLLKVGWKIDVIDQILKK